MKPSTLKKDVVHSLVKDLVTGNVPEYNNCSIKSPFCEGTNKTVAKCTKCSKVVCKECSIIRKHKPTGRVCFQCKVQEPNGQTVVKNKMVRQALQELEVEKLRKTVSRQLLSGRG